MTITEARKRVDELFEQLLPGVDEEYVLKTMERLSRGEWTLDDIAAICKWKASR